MVMNDCNKYNKSVLWAYLRDQLPIKDMIVIQHHLLTCNSCRKRIENMRKLSFAISKQTKDKMIFHKSLWFYWGCVASFLICILSGVSYYIVFTNNNNEYPVKIQKSPNYEAIDSTKKNTDSLIVFPDSIQENFFDKKLSH